MTTNLNPDIAALPLYQLGFHNGQDTGLRIALGVVVAAGYDQEQHAGRTRPPNPAHSHCATVLRHIADQLAARFRQ